MANVASAANVFRALGCKSASQLIGEIGVDQFIESMGIEPSELADAIVVFDAVIELGENPGFWW